jgi:hypothetical protein
MSAYTGKLRNEGHYILEEDGGAIGVFGGTDPANARRLVACWNACDGIPTEEIESGTAGFLHRYATVVDERDALVKERDELVAVIRSAQKAFEQGIKSDFSNILAKYPEAS